MSDGFPLGSCADAILSHGEVAEGAGRFLASVPVSYRGHRMCEFRTRCDRDSRALWRVMRVEQLIVVLEPDGKRPGCSQRREGHRT